jgi:hypothetical protein
MIISLTSKSSLFSDALEVNERTIDKIVIMSRLNLNFNTIVAYLRIRLENFGAKVDKLSQVARDK